MNEAVYKQQWEVLAFKARNLMWHFHKNVLKQQATCQICHNFIVKTQRANFLSEKVINLFDIAFQIAKSSAFIDSQTF